MRGFMAEYYNWTLHGEDIVQDYFEAPSVPQVSEEPTPTGYVEGNYSQRGDEQYMDWAQRMVFDAAGLSYFASSHEVSLTMVRVLHCGCRYKPARERDPHWKKFSYAVLRCMPLIPRLQWLYYSREIAKHMTWHATHQTEEGSMCHPSDAEVWKHFDRMYPDFAEKSCNIRLDFYIDGFAPHGQYGRTYSYWSIIITPYNLPSSMCMSSEYIFLTIVIPSPSNPKRLIDAYLEPLIEELLQLWHVGVRTYDHAMDQAFMMQLALMWTANDLPAYGMAFRWSTTGVMGCPVCMDDTRASICSMTKKSIVWDPPYWSTLLIQHNLDVMHIDKNMFDNKFNTVMDIKEKTKDSINIRRDLKIIYNRLELELDKRRSNVMPKAVYTLGKEQKRRVCEWIRGLKFSDGYASKLACCIDMTELWMHGMKSQDCHVFM
ncbi:UNVERIFIED_CONTAM: hypothetical protein Sradi_5844700 [Sesamum radiatum]|uniref:Transposase n=1 Tax=Sesamum radiatum TaxID=300843 RepID=A0AAW2KRV3_SESRA